MVKTENRPVDVKICDMCGEEVSHLSKCIVCKKDMCNGKMGKKHTAFSLEIYRYADAERICSGLVCHECSVKKTELTIGELLNGMLSKAPV